MKRLLLVMINTVKKYTEFHKGGLMKRYYEYKIGDKCKYGKVKLKCVEVKSGCTGCHFHSSPCNTVICSPKRRSDGKSVVFIEDKEA